MMFVFTLFLGNVMFWEIFDKQVSWISVPVCVCIQTRYITEYLAGGAAPVPDVQT